MEGRDGLFPQGVCDVYVFRTERDIHLDIPSQLKILHSLIHSFLLLLWEGEGGAEGMNANGHRTGDTVANPFKTHLQTRLKPIPETSKASGR